ncbi:MAG: sigma-70 factor domain-containing protein, partial [Planctomycetota bacterium]
MSDSRGRRDVAGRRSRTTYDDATQQYLDDLQRFPPLTAEAEIRLARKMAAARKWIAYSAFQLRGPLRLLLTHLAEEGRSQCELGDHET